MPKLKIYTTINTDLITCFNLSRNIDFHKASMADSNERAVAGKTSGLIELNEWVTWEATHFGVKQKLTSKITEFKSPTYFADEMVSGAFKSFKHEHHFKVENNKTLMTDVFTYQSPFGILGKLADVLFLKRYMTILLTTRNRLLKTKAEEMYQNS
ncbi:SRPBCC family protein [uncultured Winogradskyella sp.]|uniref:SRPBCC family protein n=1 Tax=uncultured Winogradskyella sp. TaxID=395353 RepID=UPI0030DDBC35|tara:strand:- start:133204 stop:133668 length:465 start_codon:yes stop_codon:yes gene_type:complete